MAADLFGDVTHAPRRLARRSWYTLPLSMLTHGAVIAAVIVIPLIAPGQLAVVRAALVFEDIDITPVVPVPPMKRTTSRRADAPSPHDHAAPTEAPPSITPEVLSPESFEPTEAEGDVHGFPGGVLLPGAGAPPEPSLADPQPAGPFRPGGRISLPRRIVAVTPIYPPIAQTARIQGTVVIDAIIGPEGDVQSARVVQSVPLLDQAALDAVRRWRYTPTLLNGVPVSVILTVSVKFTLAQ
jgi:protein TonB